MLQDNHGRDINYLRLAVTDKCNLRCYYCMPEHGNQWLENDQLMSCDEMLRISRVLVSNGITKIRVTGGEPFVRKDIMTLLYGISRLNGLHELTITTNGILTAPLVPELKKIGVRSVNLSLDTLDRDRFFSITRRDNFNDVMVTLETLLSHDIEVKVNAVVMDKKNIDDIAPLVMLTKDENVSVRFIEEMPFNGIGNHNPVLVWDHKRILDKVKEHFPDLYKIPDPPYSTSYNYGIPGHKGNIGIIAAYSRSFCGTCNRIRITPAGILKTCLYDGGVLNIKELMRNGQDDDAILIAVMEAIGHRTKDGWEAVKNRDAAAPAHESMATIGG